MGCFIAGAGLGKTTVLAVKTSGKWSSFRLYPVAIRPKVEMAEAMFEYTPQHVGDLALKVGDKIEVSRKGADGWWTGSLRGAQGNFPGELEMHIAHRATAPRYGTTSAPCMAVDMLLPAASPLRRMGLAPLLVEPQSTPGYSKMRRRPSMDHTLRSVFGARRKVFPHPYCTVTRSFMPSIRRPCTCSIF